jgi:hypothetical protein
MSLPQPLFLAFSTGILVDEASWAGKENGCARPEFEQM